MLQQQDLIDNFLPITQLGDRLFRCETGTRRSTKYYYVRLAQDGISDRDWLVVSENWADDEFARLVLANVPAVEDSTDIRLVSLPENKYGFSSMVLASATYHSYFKGILDAKREHLTLCLPIHRCEFSGAESRDEFAVMCRETVPILDWKRQVSPKILLRFDNPRTKGGTGNSPVLAKTDPLFREIDGLNGVSNGFIEIQNWRSQVAEVLSLQQDNYTLIRNRDDSTRESMSREALQSKLDAFLREGQAD